ncbi:hypothetical protein [Aureibacter tunicatorum]|uniref:DNA-binding transcriptional regulator YafY n=1 Tax=Aureibacter tunicatorum TaxID=866807 RepID=A0AAE4BR19_9BACT|nr:hypothetical protein [Aureibacter tunicatorum]MDR6239769.1 putative DNA-binding transcriptional regulator YafY [Aureibacter tunicatorum]BDD04244.1 hypothetical protein AUTU_17270 [Aureibacter tunicatorum]
MIALVSKAIKEQKVISFMYEGTRRIVEPFTLGTLQSSNNLSLSAWKVGGYSQSRSSSDWRLYTFSKMSQIKVESDALIESRAGYRADDSRMSYIWSTR